jgi:hypothetical protein
VHHKKPVRRNVLPPLRLPRRDHEKYLTLIDTIALLHQHQRPIRTAPGRNGSADLAEDGLRDDNRLRGAARAPQGQASDLNITNDIAGESRIVERAFGLGGSAFAEVVQIVNRHLKLEAA